MADVKAPALHANLMRLAEYERNVYCVSVPPGVPFKSVLAPEFWVHTSRLLKVGDKLEVLAQGGAWYAELKVARVDPFSVRMWPLHYVDLTARDAAADAMDAADYFVQLGGPHKWRVLRKSDRQILHIGEATEADAKSWLDEYVAGRATADFNKATA